MGRISEALARLRADGQAALVSYVMAGYPSERATAAAVSGLARGGADMIELGFPFSDPLADGPVIQDAAAESIRAGATTKKFFDLARKLRRRTDVPLILMTYSNIPHRAGYDRFMADAAGAGLDGMILPDMPVEEAAGYRRAARGRLDTIFLASPNTGPDRLARIAGASGGFMYMVAVYGTTGSRSGIPEYALRAVRAAKRRTRIPVGVGFGVSTPQDVRRYVDAGADAVIVGSAYLRLMQKTPYRDVEDRVASLTRRLKRQTVREGRPVS